MTIKTKRTLIFWGISLIVVFYYLYFFAIPHDEKKWASNFKNFNEANIAGRIESVEIINHGLITRLKMENNPVVFKFSPDANGNNRFEEFAEKAIVL